MVLYPTNIKAHHHYLGFILFRRILWSDFETKSDRIIVNLEKHKNLVDLEANLCHIEESESARRQQNSHQELLECLEVIKWLNPADTEDRLENLQRARVESTGTWFLMRPEVKAWSSGAQKLLWVKGIPG
jgi:hypothetical protein